MSEGKQNHQGEGGGRPRIFPTPEALQAKIDGYFDKFKDSHIEGSEKYKKAPNLFGLCLYAGMSYDAFVDYCSGEYDSETEKFSVAGEKARLRCLDYAGEHTYTLPAGAVFNQVNLTRKFKEPWKNAQHQEVTGPNNGPMQINITPNQAGIT